MIHEHLQKIEWYAAHQSWLTQNGYYTAHGNNDVMPKRADLQRAYLRGAYLQRAYLRGAYLQNADLRGAYLQNADLQNADLQNAYLQNADLQNAYLQNAELQNADLRGAKNIPWQNISPFQIAPETGQFTAYKKIYSGSNYFIAELIVPADAKRVNAVGSRKCRVSAARVIDVRGVTGEPTTLKEFRSGHDGNFLYRVGDLVEPIESFNDDLTVECASGIHCFITRREAEQW